MIQDWEFDPDLTGTIAEDLEALPPDEQAEVLDYLDHPPSPAT